MVPLYLYHEWDTEIIIIIIIIISFDKAWYRKIPEISPSKYKTPRGGLYLDNCPQILSKTKQKR